MTIREIVIALGYEMDKNSEKRMEANIRRMKGIINSALGVIGVSVSIAGLGSLMEAAAEVKALGSQFQQVFGGVKDEAQKKLDAIADRTGIFSERIKGSFVRIAAFAKTTGMDEVAALGLSERALSAVADSAAFYDRSIEEMTASLSSFLKGNYENDAALGLSATEVTRNVAANKLFKKSFKDLSEAQKQLTLLQMVEDANKMSGAFGQAARESDEWTNQIGNLKRALGMLKAAFGSGFLKSSVVIAKQAAIFIRNVALRIQELTKEGGKWERALDRIHAIVKRVRPAVDRMARALADGQKKGIGFAKKATERLGGIENLLKILIVLSGIFISLFSLKKVIDGAGKIVAILKTLGKVFGLPIIKVLALIAVLTVLAFIVEDFIHFLLGNDSVTGTFFDKAGIGAENARRIVFEAWGKVVSFLQEAWDVIRIGAGMLTDSVNRFIDKHGARAVSDFLRTWGIIKDFLLGIWTFLTQVFVTLFGDSAENVGKSQEGMKGRILSVWQSLLNLAGAIFGEILEDASSVFNMFAAIIELVFSGIRLFWQIWGKDILAWFKVIWDSAGGILTAFLDLVQGVADFITAMIDGDWKSAWGAMCRILDSAGRMIGDIINALWATIQLSFALGFGTLIESAVSGVAKIKDVLVNGLNMAIEWLKKLPDQAVQWGYDFISGLRDGILQGVSAVVEAVIGVAEKIKSYLHFSVPDVGPLTEYESWMPDFMSGLASGIEGNEHLVLDKVKKLAGGISRLISTATADVSTAAASTINNTSSSVVQNVNINNSYSGGSRETQKNISKGMKKSADDATTQMARALAYARG